MSHTLGELAKRFGLEAVGNPATAIAGVCTLKPGKPGHLSFLANPRYRAALGATQAAAVVLSRGDAQGFSGNALVAADPYLAFARVAALFDGSLEFQPGRHPSAAVSAAATVPASAHVGAHAAIEDGVVLGEGVFVGPGCVLRTGARVGDGSRLEARVYIGAKVQIGKRARIQPGAVIGSRGFGLARGPQGWEEVPQLGTVVLGDDVEVGANTTVDRGAIEDTVLEDGVKLDNQIQIAHNVRIGKHTAVAACCGIAGSTRIGARCMIGGAVGIAGHLHIADDIVIMARSTVTKSLTAPGAYSGALPVAPAREWRRQVARLRRMHVLERRLAELERRLNITPQGASPEEGETSDDRDDT
ncbi:MAG: UDP-3-O-(3-hydroxymyristoyl)glucosamine N-acyltransferase [Gammaproteobacteria bacterium]|nr:UDP-3-O-(3-hydroxymyristoyl)glucosamine N-acyltransferase [Gammaproteobacteria bacterium]